MAARMTAGKGGEYYVPYENRKGCESIVYFTRDLSAEGLEKIYKKVSGVLHGKVAVKLHTGEQHGPNIIPRPWVKNLFEKELQDFDSATIIETNTYYAGDRDTTEKHRKTLEVNGWTFAPVDITDEFGATTLPVKGGKWFTEMSVGKSLPDYDSFLALTHFKGHVMGGFGGSNKNIGIGCADGIEGKKWIHAADSGDQWGIAMEELMERMAESTKATVKALQRLPSSPPTSVSWRPWTSWPQIQQALTWSMLSRKRITTTSWSVLRPATATASSAT